MQRIAKRSMPGTSLPPKKKMRGAADFDNATDATEFIINIFQDNGFSQEEVNNEAQSKLLKLTPNMVAAYTMEASKAARDGALDKLRALFKEGAPLECCNKFGDGLINIACRRGHTSVVRFLVEEAKVCVHRADDLKRTPLHDACWTHEPNFEIVDILLRAAPMQAVCRDNRGAAPFEYARKHHIGRWLEFLSDRRSLMVLPRKETQ
jgi:ankyrin repeat protein